MTRDDEQGQSEIFGRGLPGTGGDLRRDDDVEGHKRVRFDGTEDDAEGVARRGGPENARALPTDEDDVEGHRATRVSPDGLYSGGPRTQGEFTRRGPSENPHGER